MGKSVQKVRVEYLIIKKQMKNELGVTCLLGMKSGS